MPRHPTNKAQRHKIALLKDASRGASSLSSANPGDLLPYRLRNRANWHLKGSVLSGLKPDSPPTARGWKPSDHKFWHVEEPRRRKISYKGKKFSRVRGLLRNARRKEKSPIDLQFERHQRLMNNHGAVKSLVKEMGLEVSPSMDLEARIYNHLLGLRQKDAADAFWRGEKLVKVGNNWISGRSISEKRKKAIMQKTFRKRASELIRQMNDFRSYFGYWEKRLQDYESTLAQIRGFEGSKWDSKYHELVGHLVYAEENLAGMIEGRRGEMPLVDALKKNISDLQLGSKELIAMEYLPENFIPSINFMAFGASLKKLHNEILAELQRQR